jgi:hypothetical protein
MVYIAKNALTTSKYCLEGEIKIGEVLKIEKDTKFTESTKLSNESEVYLEPYHLKGNTTWVAIDKEVFDTNFKAVEE